MKRILLALLLTLTLNTIALGHTVTVELKDGSKYRGNLDKRTTKDRVWLRYKRGSTTLLRPITWKRIRTVDSKFGKLDNVAVAKLAKQRLRRSSQSATTAPATDVSKLARNALGFSPQIRQVHLKATTTNQRTGQTGSLLVCLKAKPCKLTAKKLADVRVRGLLELRWSHNNQQLTKHIMRRIHLADFLSSHGAFVQLPFGSKRPNEGSEIKLVLTLPGHGNFQYTFEYVN